MVVFSSERWLESPPAGPPYRADCGTCEGRGGQAVHGPREWVDCPAECIPVETCWECGTEFDTTERAPDELAINGVLRPVCMPCLEKEPDDAD